MAARGFFRPEDEEIENFLRRIECQSWVAYFRQQGARTVPDIKSIVDNQGVPNMPNLQLERLKIALNQWNDGTFHQFYNMPQGDLSQELPRFEDVNWTWWCNIALTVLVIALLAYRAWQWLLPFTATVATTVVTVAPPVVAVDCIDEDAEVTRYNRSRQKISKIRVGDEVLSFSNGKFLIKKVTDIRVGKSSEMTRVVYKLPNEKTLSIYVTPGHPLWVNEKGWSVVNPEKVLQKPGGKPVRKLQVGDKLVIGDDGMGTAVDVISLTECKENRKTYNLIVDGIGTFFANGLLMHSGLPPTKRQDSAV